MPATGRRVYYHKDRLLYHLRHLCPQELDLFPDASTFNFCRGDAEDGSVVKCLEIGRVWPTTRARSSYERGPELLYVTDNGAYHSNPPDLVPYTGGGDSQRYTVEASGFAGTGVFAHFRPYHGNPDANPRLNEPLVISLIQFIFVLRGMRRYYFYTEPHTESVQAQLATLVSALHVATIGARLATHETFQTLNARVTRYAQQAQPPMDPTLKAKNTNRFTENGAKSIFLVASNGSMTDGTITDGAVTDGSTPIGVGAGSETSSPNTEHETSG